MSLEEFTQPQGKSSIITARLIAELGCFDDWEYVGKDTDITRFVSKFGKDVPIPPHEEKCICLTPIKINCYIYNKDEEIIKIVGSCCMKRFMPTSESRMKKCNNCNAAHRNRVTNLCNNCRDLPKCNECEMVLKKGEYRYCKDCKENWHVMKTKTGTQIVIKQVGTDTFAFGKKKDGKLWIKVNDTFLQGINQKVDGDVDEEMGDEIDEIIANREQNDDWREEMSQKGNQYWAKTIEGKMARFGLTNQGKVWIFYNNTKVELPERMRNEDLSEVPIETIQHQVERAIKKAMA